MRSYRKETPVAGDDLRPADVDMYRGVSSDPPVDYPTEAFPVEADPDIGDDAPIPVVVVDTVEPNDYTNWSAEQFIVGEVPIRIAGARRNRKRLLIANTGADTVYLVPGAVSAAGFGYPLVINTDVELTHNFDVYAVCAATDTATIGVIQEYVIDDE